MDEINLNLSQNLIADIYKLKAWFLEILKIFISESMVVYLDRVVDNDGPMSFPTKQNLSRSKDL